jgi:hypothetical protein
MLICGFAALPCTRMSVFTSGAPGVYVNIRLTNTKITKSTTPVENVYQISLRSIGSRGSYSLAILRSSSPTLSSVISHPFSVGGSTPWKNTHEISNPTQMMYPRRPGEGEKSETGPAAFPKGCAPQKVEWPLNLVVPRRKLTRDHFRFYGK